MPPLAAPVALFIFRRPDTTARVLERVLAARPSRLLVVADGPRDTHPAEAELCRQTRELVARATGHLDVVTHYAEANLGMRRRMASGLDWIFAQVESAILLEDDCLPEPSFFTFCDAMLARYRTRDDVLMVSGDNFLLDRYAPPASYYFSRYAHIWGWATWRRAWRLYDPDMADWGARRRDGWLGRQFEPAEALYWRQIFDAVQDGRIDTWDYQWTYACLRHGGLSVVPAQNLVTNIGTTAGTGGTSTFAADDPHLQVRPGALDFPLAHPGSVVRDVEADRHEGLILFTRPPNLPVVLSPLGRMFARWGRSLRKRL